MRATSFLLVLLALPMIPACSEPIDPEPTPVGPIVVSVGGERPGERAAEQEDEESGGQDPDNLVDPRTSLGPANPNDRTIFSDPHPPTSTLRAPADPRVEEVNSQTGLPPIRW